MTLCEHEDFDVWAKAFMDPDTLRRKVHLTIRCADCGQDFRFRGDLDGIPEGSPHVLPHGDILVADICLPGEFPSPWERLMRSVGLITEED